jgi:UDP-3-O-[3-hydroxymyristoyl] glucosamine N-acyltransferase
MEYTAQQIAEILNGEVDGDPGTIVNGFSKIEEGEKGTISFIANPKYARYIHTTKASIVLVKKDFNTENGIGKTLIRVEDPYQAIAKLLSLIDPNKIDKKGISPNASIRENAKIGKDVFVDDFVYIGENAVVEDNVKILAQTFIGDHAVIKRNTILHPGIKIYHHSVIGRNCMIHSGVVIGSDGFGFAPRSDSNYQKIPQTGNVIIEDHVEIGANTCIDRATIGSTIIRKGVKLDNLIQIAHNCEIGENTVIAAQVGIAGSTKIGRECMIGGQAGFVGHIEIADRVKVAAQSGVTSSIKEPGKVVQGAPSFDFTRYQRSYVLFRKLPDLYEKIKYLENEFNKLNQDSNND